MYRTFPGLRVFIDQDIMVKLIMPAYDHYRGPDYYKIDGCKRFKHCIGMANRLSNEKEFVVCRTVNHDLS